MGNYKRIFPTDDPTKQEKYEEYLAVSQNKQHAVQNMLPLDKVANKKEKKNQS